MATIKIIKAHNYGHVDQDGIVRLKTAADAPFELNDQRAAELVAEGVAVYVDGVRVIFWRHLELDLVADVGLCPLGHIVDDLHNVHTSSPPMQ